MSDIQHATPPDQPAPDDRPQRYVFLLLDRFTMVSFAAAIEPLRLANRIAGRELYVWRLIGEDAQAATCSNGARVMLDGGLADTARGDTILVCGGVDVARATSRPVLAWLRREARRGTRIGALCTGAWVLAEAGLLNGRRCTIHWENQDGFAEEFPDVILIRTVFVEDGNRLTAAGGTAAIDLMLRQIARDHGNELAGRVADQMIHTAIRSEDDHQRISMPSRIGARHPRLAQVVARMEANIEDPISPAVLAIEAGLSPRQLERLFARYLGRSPKRYYMEIRLERAHNLLAQTEMSVIEIALACGFSSTAHFSKCYRATYGNTPYRRRGGAGGG
ncbi:Transcriptional regulator GlxA family, contains an amidase domain and an AraC-type DNA-binding HTH domain [Paracoccus aminovorans]|uniref:Transcriptional regulator GlxA family, contains an amidase domain and an AraC-type DNA-binding HTH domain n=1 Tax=Paracoccus aminovorans TaxID=34004 RepID=A0A1I2ZWY8_9RHOB|nr:GlxA family transcriptional regulator [Paracoccus aminovorans]CQR84415.1 transcriptional regulator [Paracoccus aminovorans]SFH42324.1 Transcriptional regulator GlxA family, contains an amidase domain and an AraC-type DNA-binding HTH domain [Paracoccus aminovorans]